MTSTWNVKQNALVFPNVLVISRLAQVDVTHTPSRIGGTDVNADTTVSMRTKSVKICVRSHVQDARNGRLAIAEPEEQMVQSTDQRNGDDFQFELSDSTEE